MNDKNKYTIITCTTIVILFILKKTDSKKLARAQTIPKINKFLAKDVYKRQILRILIKECTKLT